MKETMYVIAFLFGISATIWATIKFLLLPFFEYRRILSVIKAKFLIWNSLDYPIQKDSMISQNNCLIINKYRSKFQKSDHKLKTFLLINAIQNGLSGDWGNWLCINKDNDTIICPLILFLTESAGLRAAWRSSFILEKVFQHDLPQFYTCIPNHLKYDRKIQDAIATIEKLGTEEELRWIVRNGSAENKKKAQRILEEKEKYASEIEEFAHQQTIINPLK